MIQNHNLASLILHRHSAYLTLKNLYSLRSSVYYTMYSLLSVSLLLLISIITIFLLSLIHQPTASAQAMVKKTDNVTKLVPIKYAPFGDNANISVKSNGVGSTGRYIC